MGGFLAGLLEGNEEAALGDVIDLDRELAEHFHFEELALERQRTEQESRDLALAMQLQETPSEEANQNASDLALAMQLAEEQRRPTDHEQEDLALALMLEERERLEQELSRKRQMEVRDAEIAAELAAQLEREARVDNDRRLAEQLARELEQQSAAGVFDADRELALRLTKEEEDAHRRAQEEAARAIPPQLPVQPWQHLAHIKKFPTYPAPSRRGSGAQIVRREFDLSRLGAKAGIASQQLSQSLETQFGDVWSLMEGCDCSQLMALLRGAPTAGRGRRVVPTRAYTARPVVKPALRDRFLARKAALEASRGNANVFIAFHGTKQARLSSIETGGLKVPDGRGVTHATDSGYYGRGVYTSFFPTTALNYAEAGKLIVVLVALGRPYDCYHRLDGGDLVEGFDSHVAEGGSEFVVFTDASILPIFVLEPKPHQVVAPTAVYKKKKGW